MVRLYLNEVCNAGLLNYRDVDSVKKWCVNNNIPVFKDVTQRSKQYISLAKFEEIYNKDQVIELKKIYPKNWEDWVELYNRGNFIDQVNAKSSFFKKNTEKTYRKKYKPTCDKSKKLLTEL